MGAAILVAALVFALVARATGELDGSWLSAVVVGLFGGLAANGGYALPAAFGKK